MSKGRKTFNLQSSSDMEELRKILGGNYVRRNKKDAKGVEADAEHSTSVRHLRPATGEN